MNVVRWNPFREIDALFDAASSNSQRVAAAATHWTPAVDVRESEAAYLIDLDLPAVDPAEVEITVEDGVLKVSGQREEVSETGRSVRRERRAGQFVRRFRLPEDADQESIDASSRHGTLSISIAKVALQAPRKIEVKVA